MSRFLFVLLLLPLAGPSAPVGRTMLESASAADSSAMVTYECHPLPPNELELVAQCFSRPSYQR